MLFLILYPTATNAFSINTESGVLVAKKRAKKGNSLNKGISFYYANKFANFFRNNFHCP